jgi:spore germination protein GerM
MKSLNCRFKTVSIRRLILSLLLVILLAFLLLFPEQETNKKNPNKVWKKVKIYFGNSDLNTNKYYDCSEVFPVTRWVDSTAYPPVAALRKLLEGPTKEEKKTGYVTAINSGVGIAGLWVENGLAKVKFTGRFREGGGSCWVKANVSQIKATLKQFGEIKKVNLPDPGLQP